MLQLMRAANKLTPMTGNRVLLDTNIISAWLKGEKSIAENIDKADEVFIPIIVFGELYYGAHHSMHVQANITNIQSIVDNYGMVNTSDETAHHYGVIKASLKKKGRPIPENDIWIAAVAKEHDLTLVTRDKHFHEIDGLSLMNW